MECEFPVIDFARCGLEVENDDDLLHSEVEKAGKQLYEAFCKYGFAYISNTGVPSEKINEINRITEEFFSLPPEAKIKYETETMLKMGYDPLGKLIANPKRGSDFQEAFRVVGSFLEDETALWPDVEQFKEKHVELMLILKRLLLRILKSLGIGMKLKDPELFCKSHNRLNRTGNFTTLKTINYFPIVDENSLRENQIRVGEHSDPGSITLLFQDDNGGLQAQNPEGEYVDVPPIPGTIVLNVGDCMQYWSGGRLKSTMHRVVPPRDPEKGKKTRRSVAYFGNADNDGLLSSLEFEDEIANEGNAGEIEKMTVKEFVAKRLQEYFPKA